MPTTTPGEPTVDVSGWLHLDFSTRPENAQTSKRHERRSRTSGAAGITTGLSQCGSRTISAGRQSQGIRELRGGSRDLNQERNRLRIAWRDPLLLPPSYATLSPCDVASSRHLKNKHACYRCAPNRHTARQSAVLQVQQRRHGGPKHGGEMSTRQECRLLRASDGIPRVASARRCTSLPLGTAHAPRRRDHLRGTDRTSAAQATG